jgi:hypothetical protein
MPFIIRTLVVVFLLASNLFAQTFSADKWYKGNTHTHTLNDHEYITNITPLNDLLGRTGSFLVISGQEVTDSSEGKPIHSNGLGLTKVVMPSKLANKVESLQKNIDNIRAAGGIPQLNHPNFGWALSSAEIQQLKGLRLMEIYNGHPLVNNLGGGGSPSAEAIWDELLTAGMLIYGIGDDDVHQLQSKGEAIEALPGQAWIYVRARELTSTAILNAIDSGNFYASTGVELTDYKADRSEVSLKVRALTNSKYRVQFIGSGGKVLQESLEPTAVYKIKGNEGYVRVKVLESNGKIAWTQPIMLSK